MNNFKNVLSDLKVTVSNTYNNYYLFSDRNLEGKINFFFPYTFFETSGKWRIQFNFILNLFCFGFFFFFRLTVISRYTFLLNFSSDTYLLNYVEIR